MKRNIKSKQDIVKKAKKQAAASQLSFTGVWICLCVCVLLCAACEKKAEMPVYQIDFDICGGEIVSGEAAQHVKRGDSAVPPEVIREGYAFDGWSESFRCVQKDASPAALWVKTYTVSFELNGGTAEYGDQIQSVREGSDASAPSAVREGYVFDGWDGSYSAVHSDTAVKAKWKKLYNVSFVTGSSVIVSGSSRVLVPEGKAAPAPVLLSFSEPFMGWDSDFSCVEADMTVHALFRQSGEEGKNNLYTHIFDPDGGELVLGSLIQKTGEDEAPVMPAVTKSGWLFDGWERSEAAGQTSSSKTYTYKASWKENTGNLLTVVFDPCGGTLSSAAVIYIEAGGSVTPPEAVKEGFGFLMWSCSTDNVNSNLHVRACWTQNEDTEIQSLKEKLTDRTIIIYSVPVGADSSAAAKGAGCFITSSGIAVTAAHVIENKRNIYAEDSHGNKYFASGILAVDYAKDIAVVAFDTGDKPVAFLNPADIEPDAGENIFTMGHPNAECYIMTSGTVTDPEYGDGSIIGAFINGSPGNSGGPIVNESGELIGIFCGILKRSTGLVISDIANIQWLKTADLSSVKQRTDSFEFKGKYSSDIYDNIKYERVSHGQRTNAQPVLSGTTIISSLSGEKDCDIYRIYAASNSLTRITAAIVCSDRETAEKLSVSISDEGGELLGITALCSSSYIEYGGKYYYETVIYTERAQNVYINVTASAKFGETAEAVEYDVFADVSILKH